MKLIYVVFFLILGPVTCSGQANRPGNALTGSRPTGTTGAIESEKISQYEPREGCNANIACTYDTNEPGKKLKKMFAPVWGGPIWKKGWQTRELPCEPAVEWKGLLTFAETCEAKRTWDNKPGSPLMNWCKSMIRHVPGATNVADANANCYYFGPK